MEKKTVTRIKKINLILDTNDGCNIYPFIILYCCSLALAILVLAKLLIWGF